MKSYDAERVINRLGGYMRGICHPHDLGLLRDAGIEWVRDDVPFPYEFDNSGEGHWFTSFVNYCDEIKACGMKMLAITPYPGDFAKYGIDLTTDAGFEKCADVMAYAAERLSGAVGCWQVTNEMFNIPFRAPLDEKGSAKFIGACMRGVRRGDSGCLAGYNTFIRQDYFEAVEEYSGGSDYHGIDEYPGSWVNGGPQQLIEAVDWYFERVRLPIIVMEFGFPSRGGADRITKSDIDRYIRSLGFSDIREIAENPERFIPHLPEKLQEVTRSCAAEDIPAFVTGNFEHIFKKWSTESKYPRSEDGQAAFYAEALPLLQSHPNVVGAVSYCAIDLPFCGNCGAEDCPCETSWGICDLQGNPKPAYHAIKTAYTK